MRTEDLYVDAQGRRATPETAVFLERMIYADDGTLVRREFYVAEPKTGSGHRLDPELDRFSNILKGFNVMRDVGTLVTLFQECWTLLTALTSLDSGQRAAECGVRNREKGRGRQGDRACLPCQAI